MQVNYLSIYTHDIQSSIINKPTSVDPKKKKEKTLTRLKPSPPVGNTETQSSSLAQPFRNKKEKKRYEVTT